MASYLRPRRGKAATATSTLTASAPLKRGEVFFEVPTGGVGTGQGKLKMGDGSSAYSALKYFLSLDDGTVAFTNKTTADTANNSTYLGNVIPSNSLATVLTNIKQLLVNYNSQITTLNNELVGITTDSQVSSINKRYIHGMESKVSAKLFDYTDTHITNLTTIYIEDIIVKVGNTSVSVSAQTLTLSNGTIGTNYYVQVASNGTVTISTTKTNSNTSTCIGGFHYGRVRNSTTANDVSLGIVPNSIWTLKWRPNCKNPDAMVYIGRNLWGDIYLTRIKSAASNTNGGEVYDSSAYGANPGTGTEGFCQYTFTEALTKVGKFLSSNDEFVWAADGAPEGLDGSNTNAWTATSNTGRCACGSVANSVSSLNICDLVGNVWKWNRDKYELNNGGTSYNWHDVSGSKGDCYGPGSYGVGALLSGGAWNDGSHCGSRCVFVFFWPWIVSTDFGCWALAYSL